MTEQALAKPIKANGRGVQLATYEDMYRFSVSIVKAGFAPKGFKTAEQVLVAIQAGAELGMTPMRSLSSIYVVNGRAAVYGDTPLALVRQSGLMETILEDFTGEGEEFCARCTVKRKEDPEAVTRTFSVKDATAAGLWGSSIPWQKYPKRMLQFKARAWALRDVFPDCFAGAVIGEEYVGVEEADEVSPNVAAAAEGRKPVESTVTDVEGSLEEEGQEGSPDPAPANKWKCLECEHEFAVPKVNGLCPKCLCNKIEELEKEASDV
jgi:hypothetical protein